MSRLKTRVFQTAIIFLAVANAFVISNCEEASNTSYLREPGGVFTTSSFLPDYLDASDSYLMDQLLTRWQFVLQRVVTGDFDEDGNLDTVLPLLDLASDEEGLPGSFIGRLLVCLGDGEGGFATFVPLEGTFSPGDISTGDLNEDGHLDLAVLAIQGEENFVRILFGDGSATFLSSTALPINRGPFSVHIGDVNSDGHMDVIAFALVEEEWTFTLTAFLGDGEGGFSEPVESVPEFPAKAFPWWIDVGDLDEDGRVDLAIATVNENSDQCMLIIARADREGEGRFTFSLERTLSIYPRSLVLADVNDDGHLDISILHFFDLDEVQDVSERLSVLLGNGKGQFGQPTEYELGIQGMLLKAADLDRDGADDLLVFDGTGNVIVSLGDPETILAEPCVYTCALSYPVWIWTGFLGDFNNDGNEDIGVQSMKPWMAVRFGDGKGGLGAGWFSPPMDSLVGYVQHLAFPPTDFDNDGHLDLLFYGFRNASVAFGDGTGHFPEVFTLSDEQANKEVAIGDFDEDGFSDVLVTTQRGGEGSFRLFLSCGGRTFEEDPDLLVDLPGDVSEMAVGDLNEDGHLDLVVSCGTDKAFLLLGTGSSGIFVPGDSAEFSGDDKETFWVDLTLADFNEDGHLDLFATNLRDIAGKAVLWLGDGKGSLAAVQEYPLADIVKRPVDLNEDGYLDLVVTEDYRMRVLLGRDGGEFGLVRTNLDGGATPIGDVNRDGRVDFATGWGGLLNVSLGDGRGNYTTNALFATQGHGAFLYSSRMISGDFNEDGWLDLVIGAGEYISVLINQLDEGTR